MKNSNNRNKVSIIMGSQSDYSTMKYCEKVLKILKIKFEKKIISAHRTPKRMFEYARNAEKNNISVIIARIPVIGVPIESKKLKGLDSLLSIVQMPKGIPVGTVAIGRDGAINAGLFAASILSTFDKKIKENLKNWRNKQTKSVERKPK